MPSTREHTRRVPPGLDALVLKALAAKPDDRFQTAAEMANAFGRFLATNWPGTDKYRVAAFLKDLFGADHLAYRQNTEALLSQAARIDGDSASMSAGAGSDSAGAGKADSAVPGPPAPSSQPV